MSISFEIKRYVILVFLSLVHFFAAVDISYSSGSVRSALHDCTSTWRISATCFFKKFARYRGRSSSRKGKRDPCVFVSQFWSQGRVIKYEKSRAPFQSQISISLGVLEWRRVYEWIQRVRTLCLFSRLKVWCVHSHNSRVMLETNAPVYFGLIPRDQWVQPAWIDEIKASESRERLKEQNIIYGGMCRYIFVVISA